MFIINNVISGRAFVAIALMVSVFVGGAHPAQAANIFVKTPAEYRYAILNAQPGDTIILKNGEWTDFQILFEAEGTAQAPITLRAETAGDVMITGRSNLRIAGEHLVVSGLVFTDGYSPTSAVVDFRKGGDDVASNVRFTNNVIKNFSKPERQDQDQWLILHGQNNRVDYNAFLGKTNKGQTMIVRLDTEGSGENSHIIERNYFGPRPPLGGNGGESLRIGVSQTSRVKSNTIVRENYFENADGEVEIISIKSEGNEVTDNVFYESRGSVVFRHGGHNVVSRNVFLGNGVKDTGGVRVINDNQTVTDNYIEGVRGRKFLGALVVMNGVPNSPENRYHQVENARIDNNSFFDIAHIGLGVGSDTERSAVPIDSSASNNIFTSSEIAPVGVFDDVSGIAFDNNVSGSTGFSALDASVVEDLKTVRGANGLLTVVDDRVSGQVGAPTDLTPVSRDSVGPSYFDKPSMEMPEVRDRRVRRSERSLARAIANAKPGQTLRLAKGEIVVTAPIDISGAVKIVGETDDDGNPLSRLVAANGTLFNLVAGADVRMMNVDIQQNAADAPLIKAVGENYRGDYLLHVHNVSVTAASDVEQVGPVLAADTETFANEVVFKNVRVHDWPGTVIDLSGEGLNGWYLTDDVMIKKSEFENVAGSLIKFHREGRDESTFGPRFMLIDSSLKNVGVGTMSLDLPGIDGFKMANTVFDEAGTVRIKQRVLGLPFGTKGNTLNGVAEAVTLDVFGEPMVFDLAGSDK